MKARVILYLLVLASFPILLSNCDKSDCINGEGRDKPDRIDETLNTLIPDNPKKPYDIKEVINRTVDEGYFLEIQKWTEYEMDVFINFTNPLLISRGKLNHVSR